MQTASSVPADAGSDKVNPVGPGTEFLYRVAERFGLPVVILVLVLWWARNDIVQPLLDAHFGVVREIVEGQRRHSDEVANVGRKIDALIEITSKAK
jgi:hypothetical protein